MLYLLLAAGSIPVTVWLAFGLGVSAPYELLTWPAAKVLWYSNPRGGSYPSPDVARDTLLGAGIWLAVLSAADLAIAALVENRRAA